MKTVLTIAGSDCSGGAGIQADIKTITAHKLYAMSAITSLTAQNTMGVNGIYDVSKEFLEKQLDCIFTDIYPDAVKIGMVSNIELIRVIVDKLKEYKAKNIVLDPVMVSTSGSKLISEDAKKILINELMPLADVITPNIPEAEELSEIKICEREDMEKAAVIISKKLNLQYPKKENKNKTDKENYNKEINILIKGGHELNTANDFLYSSGTKMWFNGERIDNENTHGTGCTLSSAIASNMAMGYSVTESVKNAKKYISGALKAGLNLGHGSGPLDHMYWLNIEKK